MFKFIQDALHELEHVVWPTPTETRKYMTYTVGVIVIVGVFLAFLRYGIREGLTFARAQFPHEIKNNSATVSGEDFATQSDLDKLTETIQNSKALSGASLSGIIQSGATK